MAKVKLEKILESMDSFKLNCEVSLLENEEITDLVRAQTRKDLHESFNFIKKELITGGLLEEAQTMLANTWTQAIMEDIEMPSIDDVKDFGNKVAGGAQGLGYGIAGTTGLLTGAAQGGNLGNIEYKNIPGIVGNIAQAGYEHGYNPDANIGDAYNVGKFVGANDINASDAAKAAALGIGGAAIAGGGLALAAGAANKVRRAAPKKLPAPQA